MSNDFPKIFKCHPWEPNFTQSRVQQFTNGQMIDDQSNEPALVPAPDQAEDNAKKAATIVGSNHIPAGYTYFGQFVDHDMTRDGTSLKDAHGTMVPNLRTPTLDLDSVYLGKLKENQEFHVDLLAGHPNHKDLPRKIDGKADIGDDRNDENAIVAQIHLAFMLAHNTIMGRIPGDRKNAFAKARRVLTWLYHWVILHDFLPRIIREDILKLAISGPKGGKFTFGLNGLARFSSDQIPAEFSFAAYRFGHSMVRDSYQTNFSPVAGFGRFFRIFDKDTENDLKGSRHLELSRVIQWDWFLPMASSKEGLFPQRANSINTKLAKALTELEIDTDPNHVNNFLATRNILRGIRVGLAGAKCVVDEVNKSFPKGSGIPKAKFPIVVEDDPAVDMQHSLWYYILKEAEEQKGKENEGKLGVVGSTIVAATFVQLFQNTANSWINVQPDWDPDKEKDSGLLDDDRRGKDANGVIKDEGWNLSSIIRLSGLPISGGDI